MRKRMVINMFIPYITRDVSADSLSVPIVFPLACKIVK